MATTSSTSKVTLDPQKAHIYNMIIVDESGSMHGLEQATLSGINETLATIASAQKEFANKQQQFVSIITFDTGSRREKVRTLIDAQPISHVTKFDDYNPWGGTPLYDAIGQSVTSLYIRIKDDKNATGVVTIITDGLENSSREWNASMVMVLIEKLKAEGWTFSYMGSAHNVKSVTEVLKIENVVEFSHDVRGTRNTWAQERSSRMRMYRRMDREFDAKDDYEIARLKRIAMAKGYYSGRVTPDHITQLEQDEVFVFGSNALGMHMGGAARLAVKQFGAHMGQAEGLQGQSYAIPTQGVDWQATCDAVKRFSKFAAQHQELEFLVTAVGCGHAGHTPREMAHLFEDCVGLPNVSLPAKFYAALGLKL